MYRLSTFVFKKCSEKKHSRLIIVIRAIKGFGWNSVGPASQTVAQHYISIGPMYCVIWCFWRRDGEFNPITVQQSDNTVQSPNAVSMSGQRRRLWVNIETELGECHVVGKVYCRPSDEPAS